MLEHNELFGASSFAFFFLGEAKDEKLGSFCTCNWVSEVEEDNECFKILGFSSQWRTSNCNLETPIWTCYVVIWCSLSHSFVTFWQFFHATKVALLLVWIVCNILSFVYFINKTYKECYKKCYKKCYRGCWVHYYDIYFLFLYFHHYFSTSAD